MSCYKLPLCFAASLLFALFVAPSRATDLSCKTCLDSNFYHWGPVAGIVTSIQDDSDFVVVTANVISTTTRDVVVPCDENLVPACDSLAVDDKISISGHFGDPVETCDGLEPAHNPRVIDSILRCNVIFCELLYP